MTNKEKKAKTVSIDTFAAAFIKFFKCPCEDIEIEILEKGLSARVYYGGHQYDVSTKQHLLENVIGMLTDPGEASSIDLFIWLEAAMVNLNREGFYNNLVEALVEEKQFTILHLALSISSFAPNKEVIFWKTLFDLDKEGNVFGYAIVAAAKTYDLDLLANEVLGLQILYGDQIYAPTEGGLFEQVFVELPNEQVVEFFRYEA